MKKRLLVLFLVISITIGNGEIVYAIESGNENAEVLQEDNTENKEMDEKELSGKSSGKEEEEVSEDAQEIKQQEEINQQIIEESTARETDFSGQCGENARWTFNQENKELVISGIGAIKDYENLDEVPWQKWKDVVNSIVVGDGITDIGKSAFSNMKNFSYIKLPESLQSIGEKAFYNCEQLKSIEIPDKVKSIGQEGFYACSNLNELILGKGIEKIGNYAFWYCEKLNKINITGTVKEIGVNVFNDTAVKELHVGEEVSELQDIFYSLRTLEEIEVEEGNKNYTSQNGVLYNKEKTELIRYPQGKADAIEYEVMEGIEEIKEEAFYRSNVEKVKLPKSLQSIGEKAFYNCEQLKSIEIPDKVKSIGQEGFYACNNLNELTLGKGIEKIGNYAFWYCEKLNKINITGTVKEIGVNVFNNTTVKELQVGKEVDELQDVFYSLRTLEEIEVEEGNKNYTSQDGVLYNKEKTELIRYPQGKSNVTEYEVPEGVERIKEEAFIYNNSIEKVTLSKSMLEIEKESFFHCQKLMEIRMSNKVTYIGSAAFSECTSLRSIIIPDNVEVIYSKTFTGCKNLYEIEIPNGITRIDQFAFSYCDCLSVIYYKGSKEQWKKVLCNDEQCKKCTVYYNSSMQDNRNTMSVQYLKNWNSETQTAYWGDNDLLGSTVMEETDTSFIENIDNLIGHYVWVETKSRTDGNVDSDYILRVSPLESYYGTVTSINKESCVIDNKTYSISPEYDPSLSGFEGKKVLFHLYDGDIVGMEELQCAEGTLQYWNPTTKKLKLPDEYMLSEAADQKAWGFLGQEICYTVCGVRYWKDKMNYVYSIEKYIPSEIGGYYDVPLYKNAEEKLLASYGNDWMEAYSKYIKALNDVLGECENTTKENLIVAEATRMQRIDNSSKGSRYITFDESFPAVHKKKAYKALATLLYEETNKKFDFSSVDFSSVSAGTTLVKSVMNSLRGTIREYDYGDVIIDLNITMAGTAKFGSLTCKVKKTNKTSTAVICSTQKECQETVNAYLDELKNTASSAAYNVYSSVCTDILGKSLSSLTSEYLEKQIKQIECRTMRKIAEEMNSVGVGNLVSDLNECYNYYNMVIRPLENGNFNKLEDVLPKLQELKFEDTTIEKAAVKKAMEKMNKAFAKLNKASADYLAGKFKLTEVQKKMMAMFNCPVSVAVYNSKGKQIGYIGDDDVWYSDEIIISENGDSKIVTVLTDDILTYKITGTDYGMMSCSFEQYGSDNKPIGRLNYYNVSLDPEQEYSVCMTDDIKSDAKDIMLISGNKKVQADEFIQADENGGAQIICKPLADDNTDGGELTGAGEYVRGDLVSLGVIPNEGYQFIGWYEGEDVLSFDSHYEFTADKDRSITAKFRKDNYLQVNVEKDGSGSAIGGGNYLVGDKATVLAVPEEGEHFMGWYEDNKFVSSNAEYEFEIERNITLTAKFGKTGAAKGDINNDEVIDIQDLRLILRYVCGKQEFDDIQQIIADVNEDKTVDIQDLRKVLRFICGKEVAL